MSKLICLAFVLLVIFSIAFCEDKPVARSNIVSKNNVLGRNWNKGYNNEHSENKEHHEDKQHKGHHNEDEDDSIRGPQFLRLCAYTTSSCTFTGVPSCIIVQNGACTILSDGAALMVYAIGKSITVLPYLPPAAPGGQFCVTPFTQAVFGSLTFGSCINSPFAPNNLYYKFLPFRDIDDA